MRSTPHALKLRTHTPKVSYEFLVRRMLGTWKIGDHDDRRGDRLNHVADVGWTMLMSDGVHYMHSLYWIHVFDELNK